jgi:hypothetical protein
VYKLNGNNETVTSSSRASSTSFLPQFFQKKVLKGWKGKKINISVLHFFGLKA